MYELRKAQFKYYFLNENCGYRLERLLGVIFQEDIPDRLFYTLPIEALYRYKDKISSTIKIPPYSTLASKHIEKLKDHEFDTFNNIVKGKETLLENHSESLRTSIFYYYSYNFKKNGVSLPNLSLIHI